MKSLIQGRHLLAAAATAVLPLSLLALAPVAQAAPVTGHLAVVPSSGSTSTVLDVDTKVACAASDGYVRVEISGTGIDPTVQNVMMSPRPLSDLTALNSYGGYHLNLSESLFSIFQANGVTHPNGVYTIDALCLGTDAFTINSEITGRLQVTAGVSTYTGTYTQLPDDGTPTAITVTKKPTISGKAKVGKSLSVSKGTWSPKPTSYAYQWLRNGKAIKHASKATYKLVKADKGKKVSCKVTAKKSGYTNGVATSAAKKVS